MSELEAASEAKVVLSPPGTDNECDNNANTGTKRADCEEDIASLSAFQLKMYRIIKELIVMFVLFVTYAALTHDPPKITRAPPAYPFFPRNSLVRDFFRGEISGAVDAISESDIMFIMFYAPWDAESQEVRGEMELAARHMNKLVAFTAVNCWQPRSECRSNYNKVFSWPVMIAYTTHGRVIQYNGPKTAPHIIRFLNNIINPFVRVNSTMDIYSLLATHDAVVVAGIDTRPGSLDFAIFYSVALKYLEKDPFRDVAFAVLSKSAGDESFFALHMWNETLFYPTDEDFNLESVGNWLSKHIHQVSIWISPTGMKSQQLSMYLQGPSLFLFTPYNPLAETNDFYSMYREVAMEYFNCNSDLKLFAKQKNIYWHRKLNFMKHKKVVETCGNKELPNGIKYKPTVTYSTSFWQNNSACWRDRSSKCYSSELNSAIHWSEKSEIVNPDESPTQTSSCFSKQFKTSQINDDSDPKSPYQLKFVYEKHNCKMHQLRMDFMAPLFSLDKSQLNITGLGCHGNRTLTFIAMDSLNYHHFAEQYGVNVLKQKNKTALLLINENEEVHHVFEGSLNSDNLREFIINFTESNLPRAFHSSSVRFKYTHVYPIQKDCNSNKSVCVDELDAKSFLPTIMEENKVVIVFYHSKQCSFCTGISYTYLTAAKILSFVKNIKFTRIDGDLNTLPWEYTMETYPTILLFPAKRKSESRAFPTELPITVTNLISFVLTNLDSSMKLNVMWSICKHTSHVDEQKTCISSLRTENLAVIEETLKEWRKADPHMKSRILRKLQHLRNLHFELAVSPHNQKSIKKHLEKIENSNLNVALLRLIHDQVQQWQDDL